MPRRAIATMLSLAALGCDRAREGPPFEVRRTLFSLVAREDLRQVVREDERHPVRARMVTPVPNARFDGGSLPALELRPACEVAFDVPASEAGAELRFAVGFDASAYLAPSGGAVFELELDGQVVFDHSEEAHAGVERARRAWRRAAVPIGPGGRVVLRTRPLGEAAEPAPAAFALLEVVAPFAARRTRASPSAPSVVLILVDTLRADRLHFAGHAAETSPSLDALAARGTVFENAFSPSPWTWPSTASILTSLAPPEHGFLGPTSCYLADELETLAESFQRAGFTTAAFSFNNLVAPSKNFDQGFERFVQYDWTPTSAGTAEIERWLEESRAWRFFLYLHLVDPHGPYEPAPELARRFAGDPPEHFGEGRLAAEVKRMQAGEAYDEALVERHRRHLLGLYDGEIATVDGEIGRVLAKLRELGLEDRTLVAVTSDHGEEFLEHRMGQHGKQLFDESVHVPLVIAGPGVPAGRREAARVRNRFLGPTLLALAGVEPHANLRGPSLLDPQTLAGGELPTFFMTELGAWIDPGGAGMIQVGELYGVQAAGLRLMWAPREGGEGGELVALYDTRNDPGMLTDVARERPAEVARLKELIAGWRERGEAIRPALVPADRSTFDELRRLGYVGDE